MIPEQLDDLYKLLRGSRSATLVLDARALFQDDKFAEALDKLVDAREAFMESRSRLLRQDADKEFDGTSKDDAIGRKKLVRKQDKTRESLKAFDDLVPKIERFAKQQAARSGPTEPSRKPTAKPESVTKTDASPAGDRGPNEPDSVVKKTSQPAGRDPEPPPKSILVTPADITPEFVARYVAASRDEQLDVINQTFGFREVRSEDDLYPSAVYFVYLSERSHLIRTPLTAAFGSQIDVTSLVNKQSVGPFSKAEFLELGATRRMVLLTKSVDQVIERTKPTSDLPTDDPVQDDGEGPVLLDMAAFSQLLTAAQRSGLVSGADQIGHIRDREFRLGNHELAFQSVNALFSQFASGAASRTQQLAREDADIASGKLKISPKDLLAKRARDRAQTQEVDRAMRRFQVVLEGLRQLMASGT